MTMFVSKSRSSSRAISCFSSLVWLAVAACSSTHAAKDGVYASPEAAVHALVDAAASDDQQRIDRVLGPGSADMLRSGDPIADLADAENVQEMLSQKLAFEDNEDGSKTALLGNDGWSLPIPLVQDGDEWRFDVEAGRVEIANRRVGRNEISTIATLHAFVDAQREYQSEGRDGKPQMYAQRLMSTPGKHDGLYWETKEGEPESPIGELVAEASEEGYGQGQKTDQGGPYHGYRFRMLRAQGSHAPGGQRKYIDAFGNMTGGFGLIAWPAKYGSSGVMSFIVNQRGIVYQKDLGEGTESVAAGINSFDPDSSWDPTGD
jgi:hypothetical protein